MALRRLWPVCRWPTWRHSWVSVTRRLHQHTDDYCEDKTIRDAPLNNIKVLDLSRILAGPFCTMLLGDMGAEVIKVEKPGVGDDTRSWGPPWVGKESAYFLSINRNKKSIAVDMKSEQGAKIVKELATSSDVLVENYVPGKLSHYGLSYEQLRQVNPRLIYVSISGFGSSGPYVNRGGYDNIALAIGGLLHITGPEDGEPCRSGVALVDLATGLYAVGAVTASLLHREKTGRGQHIECNLLSTEISLLTHIASNWLNCGVESQRWGSAHPSIVPYQAFETKDDGHYIMLAAGNNRHFVEFCKVLNLEELPTDDRFIDNNRRVINRRVLIDIIATRVRERTLEDWLKAVEGVSFPYGPVKNIQQVFSDPQVLHSKIVQDMDHPTAGKIRVAGPAVSYSDSSVVLQHPPPTLGQHTTEILRERLGYDSNAIQQLLKQGIINDN